METQVQQETPTPPQTEPKPKHTRRSRKSIVGRIEDTMFAIDWEIAAGTQRPARLNALTAKLEAQMRLLKREDAARQDAVTAENIELKRQIAELQKAPKSDLDAQVAKMLVELNTQRQTPVTPVTPTPVTAAPGCDATPERSSSRPVSTQPPHGAPVDSDLLI